MCLVKKIVGHPIQSGILVRTEKAHSKKHSAVVSEWDQ